MPDDLWTDDDEADDLWIDDGDETVDAWTADGLRIVDGSELDDPEADEDDLVEEPADKPLTDGGHYMIAHSIDILRNVASHAADNLEPPQPGAEAFLPSLPPRVARFMAGFLANGSPPAAVLRVIAQALTTLLPLADRETAPAGPRALPEPSADAKTAIGILRRERAARARERGAAREAAEGRARPDIPPSLRAPADVVADRRHNEAWNDLLDVVSQGLEVFIAFGDRDGVNASLELIELIAGVLGVDLPEAA